MPLSVRCIAICVKTRKLCLMTAVYGEPRPANTGQGWTVDDSTFGARLALVRQRMQWNIKEAARECGIPAASWGTWENGAMPRRYTEMCRLIAERTGCDYGWLVLGPQSSSALTTHGYSTVTEPSPAHIDRPRDNRPSGHPPTAAGQGVGRTAYLTRPHRRRRDS
jgi:transcriptional regulator with XRE-family HTH domain